jgi:hypothetical protein
MKLRLPILTTLIFSFTFSAPFCAQGQAQLRDPGVYATTSSGPLRLAELPMPGQRTTSWARTIFGDDRLSLHYTWEGGSSFATVSERRPTFRVNLGYLPSRGLNAIQIVKLEQSGNYRKSELRWNHDIPAEFRGAVAVGYSRGIDGEILVQPSADLAPGEYMLSLGALGTQYDFSVR